MIRRLVLWDIDGTLVHAGGLGADVFDIALEKVVGRKPAERVRMSGKTDPQIVRESLALLGVEPSEGTVPAILRHLEEGLAAVEEQLREEGSTCEGAASVLELLAADERVLSSVLTGNIAPNAVVKLAAFGLDRWLDLEIGAYGSDDDDRNVLVPIAVERAASLRGVRVKPADVWVVGDTPRDLACAQAAGARCLLVGTGRYPMSELTALGADEVVEDLTGTEGILKILTGDL